MNTHDFDTLSDIFHQDLQYVVMVLSHICSDDLIGNFWNMVCTHMFLELRRPRAGLSAPSLFLTCVDEYLRHVGRTLV